LAVLKTDKLLHLFLAVYALSQYESQDVNIRHFNRILEAEMALHDPSALESCSTNFLLASSVVELSHCT
jgi:hypothetical protein